MKPFHQLLSKLPIVLTVFLSSLAPAQSPDAPIVNFKLPLFNDNGYRTGYLKGKEGTYVNLKDKDGNDLSQYEIRILGMELSQYSGDERDIAIGSLESPEALFRTDKNNKSSASGPGFIKLENDRFRLTGEDWIWQESKNQIVINKNVKITIFDKIGNLIK